MRLAVVGDRLERLPLSVRAELHRRPHLAALTLAASGLASAHDRALLAALLATASGAELALLDRAARSRATLAALGLHEHAFTVADVDTAAAADDGDDAAGDAPDTGTALLCVLSTVRDGRVREAATAALASRRAWPATAALFVRTDDVVPAVAACAVQALERRLGPALLDDLVVCAPLVETRDAAVRTTPEGTRLRAEARALLLADHPASVAALRAGIAHAHPAVRAACGRLVLVEGSAEESVLTALLTALDDGTPGRRRFVAARVSRGTLAPSVLRALLPRLVADPLPALRRAAASAARHLGRSDVLEALTVDASADVRVRARAWLGRAGGEEQRERACAVLARAASSSSSSSSSSSPVRGALGALAEIGRPADFPFVAAFLHDPRTRVVAEAVRALAGIHASGGLEAFADVLNDKLNSGSAAVALEAARGLALLPAHLRDAGAIAARRRALPGRRLRVLLDRLEDG